MVSNRLTFLALAGAGAATALGAPAAAADIQNGATLVALYKKPSDTAAFDAYYHDHHAPLARTLPGLVSFTIGRPGGDASPYYQIAILTFASMSALQASLASATGKAVVGDLKNFAQAGVEVLTFDQSTP